MADYITHQKALFLDMVYLQQDAFDPVDVSAPLDRRQRSFPLVYSLVTRDYDFADKVAAREYFTRLTGLFKNLNYTRDDSPDYASFLQQIDDLAQSVSTERAPPATALKVAGR